MSRSLDPEQYRLSDADHHRIFNSQVIPALFRDQTPTARPHAVVFGGQPGAGKSASVAAAAAELRKRGGAVRLVGDDLRGYHPRYAELLRQDDKSAAFYTDRDTARWIEKAIEHARTQRVHIVIEGTMRDADKVAKTLQDFRAAGFATDARALAVHERVSELGILTRYELQHRARGSGRMTTPEAHQAAYAGLPKTLDRIEAGQLADRVRLLTRTQGVLFDSRSADGGRQVGASSTLLAERSRPFSVDELRQLVGGYQRVAGWMAERDAPAVERDLVSDRLRSAQADLAQHPDRDRARGFTR